MRLDQGPGFDGWRRDMAYWKRADEGPLMSIERYQMNASVLLQQSLTAISDKHCAEQDDASSTGCDQDELAIINPAVALEAEVPEILFEGMKDYLSSHPNWDQSSLIVSAIAEFLFQNGCHQECVTQHYFARLVQPD